MRLFFKKVKKMTEEKIHILTVKYLTKESSAEEAEELLTWLLQNENHRQLFRSLKDAYDLGQFEKHIQNSDTTAEWEKLLQRIRPAIKQTQTKRLLVKIARYAAVFVLGLMGMKAIDLFLTQKDTIPVTPSITKIETDKGERSKVTLPDSTIVWLSACTAINYDQNFGVSARKINMQGEAYFEVRKDASKPFTVCTDSLTYLVTGTSFNVYSFNNDNVESLVLIEGAVTLSIGDYRTEVKPGELIEFDKTARKVHRRQVKQDFYTSWRSGELMFDKMTFEELAGRLERNFKVTFIFENERVKKESFSGTFRYYDTLETILKVITTSTPITYRIDKGIVYIK